MKLLVIVSSLDLRQPFSATPAWWQLLKALYEVGVDIIATPYQGPAIEAPWWRAAPNPTKLEGDAFKFVRDTMRRFAREQQTQVAGTQEEIESRSDRAVRQIAQTVIAPRWRRHVDRILTQQPDIDAVIVITLPLNHVPGLAQHITEKHNKPVFFYDGDVPASLPNFMGFATGFRIYQGADLSEYTAFFSNSEGGKQGLIDLGARAAHTLFYGADEDLFAPLDVTQDLDAFFYGHGREYRGEWIDALVRAPSLALPDARFAVRGTRLGDIGKTQMLPYLSFSKLREYACRSKLNLVITRKAHASVFASSSSRPFELASLGACMVCSPYGGIETWFEPEKELIVVHSAEEAIERYTWLLAHDTERRTIGTAARERFLKEHTFRHRAQQLVDIVKGYLT
ncbi:MAG: glycosyltransferase [Anaerolineae bacterium]|nr:glycosyltransferase [Anaerolineae bacterium]